jgi:uncharacterized protein (DUF885 family)
MGAALPVMFSGCASKAKPAPDKADFAAFFESAFDARVAQSPTLATSLGDRRGYDRWDDVSDARAQRDLAQSQAQATELRTRFASGAYDESEQLSIRLFLADAERGQDNFKWRRHRYRFDQMGGVHAQAATFLLNQHKVQNADDASAYIARLNGMKAYLDGHVAQAEASAEAGILMPAFVYNYAIPGARNIITGAPFTEGPDSPILADIKRKLSMLTNVTPAAQGQMLADAEAALKTSVQPAYENVIAMLERHKAKAGQDDGVWRLPDGENYYAALLKRHTTTTLSAETIHDIGLGQVARIHAEMTALIGRVAFAGDLREFFDFMEKDPRFFEPDTPQGKASYIAKATRAIDSMKKRLPEVFATLPKAELVVRAVEPFREKSAGLAFYERPAPDGSRPGVYYANTSNMKGLPLYQLEALAYHEGVPGHHLQIAIAQELEGVPRFRRFGGGYTAYSEGWALYCELLAKEMGLYEDPYSDFGRLVLELRRAIRLVVDTGLHHKRWNRERAIAYILANQPSDEEQARRDIDRYIVNPGQATAYMIGQMEILRLREEAKRTLGSKFDLRQFHDVVLRNGAVPLDVLGENVTRWVRQTRA